MKSLAQIYRDHHGKISDKWSLYLSEYDRLLAGYRDRPVSVLEIGVQNGGSLEIWLQFFARAARIVGCDIDPKAAQLRYDDARVAVVVADAGTDAAERQIRRLCASFDIIIDDGSHRSVDIVRNFARYFPLLNDGGVYVVEDLHCSYWDAVGDIEHAGGLYHPDGSVAFFKALVDVINFEHWGVEDDRAGVLDSFAERYGAAFQEEALARIHSIEFVNSLAVIRRRTAEENGLGVRVVSGSAEAVTSDVKRIAGQPAATPDQRANLWSRPVDTAETRDLTERLAAALRQQARAEAALAGILGSTSWRVLEPVRWFVRRMRR